MNEPNDNAPDLELQRLQQTYRSIPGEEPPARLDQAVLNRARREIASPEGRRPWSFGWVHGLTSAAVLVLAVAIFTHQPEPPVQEAVRVANPPSPKLRDIEAEIKPLRIPARERAAAGAPPTLARQLAPASAEAEERAADKSALLRRTAEAPSTQAAAESAVVADESAPDAEAVERPEEWLGRIIELKSKGEDEAVQRELEAFRQAWPEHPLPPELRD